MSWKQKNIKNIVFDLGGVLLNINYQNTTDAFKQLGFLHFEAMYSQFKVDQLFEKLETGNISEADFFTVLKKVADTTITDEQIRGAWCAMLLNFKETSIAHLAELAKRYNIYLLSNTNIIHYGEFLKIYAAQFNGADFDRHFIKTYYSHEIKLRKPEIEIYEFVLADAGLNAQETLFIDDTNINIEAAQRANMHTHFLMPNEAIEDLGL